MQLDGGDEGQEEDGVVFIDSEEQRWGGEGDCAEGGGGQIDSAERPCDCEKDGADGLYWRG